MKTCKILPLSVFWILVMVFPFNAGQATDIKKDEEMHKFIFNREIAIKYTVIALEEYEAINRIKTHLADFNTSTPILNSIQSKDCDGNKRKVILVCFPAKNKKGYAVVHLILSKDGYLSVYGRGYTNRRIDALIDEVKSGDFWSCGS